MNEPEAMAVQIATARPALPIERDDGAPAIRDRDEGGKGGTGEQRAPGELCRRADRELPLQHACARPRQSGESDEQLPAPAYAPLLDRDDRQRHGQTTAAASAIVHSFARWSSMLKALPMTDVAKPH